MVFLLSYTVSDYFTKLLDQIFTSPQEAPKISLVGIQPHANGQPMFFGFFWQSKNHFILRAESDLVEKGNLFFFFLEELTGRAVRKRKKKPIHLFSNVNSSFDIFIKEAHNFFFFFINPNAKLNSWRSF